jgi:hypothetical protein
MGWRPRRQPPHSFCPPSWDCRIFSIRTHYTTHNSTYGLLIRSQTVASGFCNPFLGQSFRRIVALHYTVITPGPGFTYLMRLAVWIIDGVRIGEDERLKTPAASRRPENRGRRLADLDDAARYERRRSGRAPKHTMVIAS